MNTIVFIFVSILLVSLVSLVGVFLLSLHDALLRKMLLPLVGFATGTLFANAFLHLLPEAIEAAENPLMPFSLTLAGIILFFIIEKFIHWHHCHTLDCPDHTHPLGTMMLIGDGVHNITDGILIASAFLVSTELGIATTVAVLFHEIPQEIGDFAVLIHSGYSRMRALAWNLISAATAFLGAIVVILLHRSLENIELILIPLTAGNFLYIAGSDLLPELHKEVKFSAAFRQLLCILAGIAVMAIFLFNGESSHAHNVVNEEVHRNEKQELLDDHLE